MLVYPNARTSLCFVCVFDGGGFFFLLIISVGVDVGILIRVFGCAEAKSIGDGDELELEDIGTKEDCSWKAALVLMTN